MPRKTPEERATAAVDALVAKRDKLQSDLNDVNDLLQKLGQSIGVHQHRSDPEMTATEVVERRPAEMTDSEKQALPKELQAMLHDAENSSDEFPVTIRAPHEPDYQAIMDEDDSGAEGSNLAGGDNRGEGRWV